MWTLESCAGADARGDGSSWRGLAKGRPNNGLELTRSAMASGAALAAQPGVLRTERCVSRAEANGAIALALQPRRCVPTRIPASWLCVESRASRLLQQVGQESRRPAKRTNPASA
jgi:hypothetical protein